LYHRPVVSLSKWYPYFEISEWSGTYICTICHLLVATWTLHGQ